MRRSIGIVYLWRKQHEQAIVEGEKAITLGPNYADGYACLGHIFNFAGRPEEAIEVVQQALRLNPHDLFFSLFNLGFACRVTGRHEEAITALKRACTLNPASQVPHVYLAALYSELGREEEARAEAAEVLRIIPEYSLEVLQRILPFKDQAELERLLASLRKAGLE